LIKTDFEYEFVLPDTSIESRKTVTFCVASSRVVK
jgi:hypothetical protein